MIASSTTVHDVMVTIAGYGSVLETATTNLLGQTTRTRSDGAGRVIETVDAAGFITKFEYDANGNRLRVRDPNGVGQDCQYDALNRDIFCTDTQELLDGTNRRKEYDLAGNVLKQIDAKGNTTYSYFDSRNRLFETKDRNNATTSFTHDANGNELSMTDAENQTTSYLYDPLNRRTKITWPDHVAGQNPGDANCGFETVEFDPAGRVLRKTNQLGDTITHVYDAVGRMLSRDYRTLANSPSGAIADTDTFTYDSAGRMLTATKGRYSNTVTFTYENGRKLTEALAILGQTYTVTSGYDAAGRENSLTYPDGSTVTRTHTNRGQLASVSLAEPNAAAQSVSTFAYDNGGRETSRTYGNGVTTTRSYAADNMVTTIDAQGVESLTYTYDANKNPTGETRSGVMAAYSWATGQNGFDNQNRLTGWSRTNGDAQTWQLSPVNDWQSFTNNNQTQTRTHGPTHEVLSVTNAGNPTPAALQHDAKGNLTQDDRGCQLTYDADNMLSAFGANNVESLKDATYAYDALGRRVAKSVTTPAINNNPASTTTTIYALSGQQVIAEYSSSNAAPATLSTRTTHGTYIDEPLALLSTLNNQPSTLYYHANRQYSTYTLTNNTGAAVERYTYTPYGQPKTFDNTGTETANSQPVTANLTLFTGRTLDTESSQLNFRDRVFNNNLGRFTTHDLFEYIDGNNAFAGWFAPSQLDPFGEATIPVVPQGMWSLTFNSVMGVDGMACGYKLVWAPSVKKIPRASTQYWQLNKIDIEICKPGLDATDLKIKCECKTYTIYIFDVLVLKGLSLSRDTQALSCDADAAYYKEVRTITGRLDDGIPFPKSRWGAGAGSDGGTWRTGFDGNLTSQNEDDITAMQSKPQNAAGAFSFTTTYQWWDERKKEKVLPCGVASCSEKLKGITGRRESLETPWDTFKSW